MSALRFFSATFLATLVLIGCVKDNDPVEPAASSGAVAELKSSPFSLGQVIRGRYAGPDYSQSIPVTDANKLISSYLTSVNYPTQDSALRSLTFDADTLRAYLADTSIVTLKFFVAHTPAYANNAETYGKYAGMKPSALTLVVAGMNSEDNYVRSSRNGFYEHFNACPQYCPGNADAILH